MATTPRELWDLAYRELSISRSSFISDEDELSSFELSHYNFATQRFFAYLKDLTSRTNNIVPEYSDIVPSEILLRELAGEDVSAEVAGFERLFLGDSENIVSVYAKLNDTDDDYTELEYISPKNINQPVVDFITNSYLNSQGPRQPSYTTLAGKLYIFPNSATERIENGLITYIRRGYVASSTLEQANAQIPQEYARVIIPYLCSKIAERNGDYQLSDRYRILFNTDVKTAVSELSNRSSEQKRIHVGGRRYAI